MNDFKKTNQNLELLHSEYPYLFLHIRSLNINEENDNSIYGNRFKHDAIPIYLLLSMSGGYYASILQKFFVFPSIRTCLYYKQKLKIKYDINENLLDGSIESIQKLALLSLKDDEEEEEKRYVLAVNTAAIDAKILIHKNGDVEGLIGKYNIDQEMYKRIMTNLDSFHQFSNEHHDEIV